MRALVPIALLSLTVLADAQVERFVPPQDTQTQMWRLTDDPSWRDWAEYHIRNCWSPDGRYVATTRYRNFNTSADGGPFVRVFDVASGEVVREFARANYPRWANHHRWLLFIQRPDGATLWNIMWWDLDADRLVQLEGHSSYLGGVDWQDEYLYASAVTMPDGSSAPGARVPLREGGLPAPIEVGGQLDANPGHPQAYTRISNYFEAFKPTRLFLGADGTDLSVASPTLQQCHQSWSGGGEWYMFGNQQMRGRRWDEPFPSNWHFLASIGAGDICRGCRTDRYVISSGSVDGLAMADLRSGDGWEVLPWSLSYIHDSPAFQYSGDSAFYDNDGKGSPDGTKICFVSTYDLRDGPLTFVTQVASPETGPGIHVRSTAGFPEQGRLSVRTEIIAYERKTETSFEGLTRGLYGTGAPAIATWTDEQRRQRSEYPPDIGAGSPVTSFDARLIPEELRAGMTLPARFTREDFADRDSPLLWQRQTDVYVAVARPPDRPWLREREGGGLELIPGELHFETRGYRVLRDGQPITPEPLEPGAAFDLPGAGAYSAEAVEWSGLESAPSNEVRVAAATALTVLPEAPEDFSWTTDRWLVADVEASEAQATAAPEAVREIVHRYDGVIHREWYERGVLVRRHDLTPDGLAIRRLFYEGGRLASREYWNRAGVQQSLERFDADGFITEATSWRNGQLWDRWWFIKGTPVKLWTERGGHHTASPERGGTYVKQGIEWVKID